MVQSSKTDAVSIDADVLEVAEELDALRRQCPLHRTVCEDKDATAEPIDEVWHLVKPRDGKALLVVGRIQQIQ